jgi:hypothetical protein
MEEPKLKQILFTSTKNKRNKKEESSTPKNLEQKDVYFDLLLAAADGVLERGLISVEELYVTNEELRYCDNRACNISGPKKHSMWNKVKQKAIYSWLCDECFKAFKNGQFCCYCNTIYRDDLNDYIYTWIQCDYCELWHHLHCEESKGDYPNISKLIADPCFKYMCLQCRAKRPKRKYKEKLLGRKTSGTEFGIEKRANKRTSNPSLSKSF